MRTEPNFKDNKLITLLIPAACLSLLTFGTVSVYGIPDDLMLPAGFLMMIIFCTLLLLFLRLKNESIV